MTNTVDHSLTLAATPALGGTAVVHGCSLLHRSELVIGGPSVQERQTMAVCRCYCWRFRCPKPKPKPPKPRRAAGHDWWGHAILCLDLGRSCHRFVSQHPLNAAGSDAGPIHSTC